MVPKKVSVRISKATAAAVAARGSPLPTSVDSGCGSDRSSGKWMSKRLACPIKATLPAYHTP